MFLLPFAKSLIDSYDVVSFDIFDTLLVRPYIKPIDLFIHLERLHGANGFAKHRVQAELNARKRESSLEDITIEQIYREVNPEFKKFQSIEVEFEAQVLRANKGVKAIYDYAIERGKMVIIASDMYLGSEIMTPILAKCDYCSHNKLYMSCDLNRTKHTGNLYEYIVTDLGVDPSSIIHFGDNQHSDVKMANKLGINGFYIPKVIDTLFENNERARALYHQNPENLGVSTLLGLLAQCEIDQRDDYWRNFGFMYGGAVIYSFVRWILQETKKNGVEELLFVARDGYILKRVAELCAPTESEKFHYVYAPRLVNIITTLDYKRAASENAMDVFLGYFKSKDRYIKEHAPTKYNSDEAIAFIEANIDHFRRVSSQVSSDYNQYISGLNLKGEKIAIIDSVTMMMSAQRQLLTALPGKDIAGYYWLLFKQEDEELIYYSYKGEEGGVEFDWNVMELFMSAPELPIIEVTNDGKPIYREERSEELIRMKLYPHIATGIEDFARLGYDIFGDIYTYIDFDIVNKYMNLLSQIPSDIDRDNFDTIKHPANCANSEYISLFPLWTQRNINNTTYYLFHFIPIYKIKRYGAAVNGKLSKTLHLLFGFIPVYKHKLKI